MIRCAETGLLFYAHIFQNVSYNNILFDNDFTLSILYDIIYDREIEGKQ